MSKILYEVPDGDRCDDCKLITFLTDEDGLRVRVCDAFKKVLEIEKSFFGGLRVNKCDECINQSYDDDYDYDEIIDESQESD